MLALLDLLVTECSVAFAPAGVVAQAWRGGKRQHAVARLLHAKAVRIDPMDESTAYQVGTKLAQTGTSDVVDAHVALLAAKVRGNVLTSDPDDIRAIDSTLPIIEI